MKNLKNIFLIIIALITFSSCSEDEKANLGLQFLTADSAVAPLVLYWTINDVVTDFPVGDENASFKMTLVSYDPNIVSHTMYVERVGGGDPVQLRVTTVFPSTFNIVAGDIAQAFGENWADYAVNTRFKLTGTSVDKDGFIMDQEKMAQWVDAEATNAYDFNGLSDIKVVAQ